MTAISEKLNSKKVAIYIRVSTRYQVDKDSLQVQRRELIAYSEMILGTSDYVIFEDAGYSAKNTDRPDYQRMMDRLRTGEFSHLLVWMERRAYSIWLRLRQKDEAVLSECQRSGHREKNLSFIRSVPVTNLCL